MNNHDEFRQTYIGAAPHTITIGIIWILSGIISNYVSILSAILIFFFGAAINFPIGELIRKKINFPNIMSKNNDLAKLFPLLSFTIPLSVPIIYMASIYNINWFFPAFSVLVGAHYLPFAWAYQMSTFILLGILIIISGCLSAYFFSDIFYINAYLTGSIILIFGIIHFIMVKKEIKNKTN